MDLEVDLEMDFEMDLKIDLKVDLKVDLEVTTWRTETNWYWIDSGNWRSNSWDLKDLTTIQFQWNEIEYLWLSYSSSWVEWEIHLIVNKRLEWIQLWIGGRFEGRELKRLRSRSCLSKYSWNIPRFICAAILSKAQEKREKSGLESHQLN